jgi:electron transfer flavoprotein beta subunit
MTLDVAVLVSRGRHPASGRARRADADARALELAMCLDPASVDVVHAGDANEAALADYLGMGIERLTVLAQSADADPMPSLVAYLEERRPALVLAGTRAERGECSGFVPYAVAEALGYGLAPGIVGMTPVDHRVELLQALPRGQRRVISAALPLVVTVDRSAPMPRQVAYVAARRGDISVVRCDEVADDERLAWERRPARRRGRRLVAAQASSAAERLAAVSEMRAGEGRLMADSAPAEAARAIRDYLVDEGILDAGPASPGVPADMGTSTPSALPANGARSD